MRYGCKHNQHFMEGSQCLCTLKKINIDYKGCQEYQDMTKEICPECENGMELLSCSTEHKKVAYCDVCKDVYYRKIRK